MNYLEAISFLEKEIPPHPDAGFLGVDLDPQDAKLVMIPVPWEATVSYGQGTASGPMAIKKASHQLDMIDPAFGQVYRCGLSMLQENEQFNGWNREARAAAEQVIAALENGEVQPVSALQQVNSISNSVTRYVNEISLEFLNKGKIVAVVGGDHSSPLGLISALGKMHKNFSVLHIDAHHDLRQAYEGFTQSHASIFYNVMTEVSAVQKLVQVGIRDYSASEKSFMQNLQRDNRGVCFYDLDLFAEKARGKSWEKICKDIISSLTDHVYVSFDIDGLDPSHCPSTGTPVPGGLNFHEACFLMEELSASGKKIVGFDLCEVCPGENSEWDQNVAARLLYRLSGACMKSQGFL